MVCTLYIHICTQLVVVHVQSSARPRELSGHIESTPFLISLSLSLSYRLTWGRDVDGVHSDILVCRNGAGGDH